MILMTIATIIVFKNKYYIHHLIAIIGFILFGNISDIFLDYYTDMTNSGILFNVITLASLILDVIFLSTQKYLLEKLLSLLENQSYIRYCFIHFCQYFINNLFI